MLNPILTPKNLDLYQIYLLKLGSFLYVLIKLSILDLINSQILKNSLQILYVIKKFKISNVIIYWSIQYS